MNSNPHDAPQRLGRPAGCALWHSAVLIMIRTILVVLLSWHDVVAQGDNSINLISEAVETPEELQEQVRLGTPHIVITQHLDMTATSPFSDSTTLSHALISIVQAGDSITQTIRGNCAEQPAEELAPLRLSATQCIISVPAMFLEVQTEGAQVWLSDFYIKFVSDGVVGADLTEEMTLVGVHQGGLYLTNMTMVGGARSKTRAMDVKQDVMLYVAQSVFSGFKADSGAVVNLEPGAIATFSSVTFENNEASVAGPVASLSAKVNSGAAVWFQGCTFLQGSNSGPIPGEVVVESRECHVFSNTWSPTVWDVEEGQEVNPWLLAPAEDGSVGPRDVFQGLVFPSEVDEFFTNAAAEQAAATGLPEVAPSPLPDGYMFITVDPYPSTSAVAPSSDPIAMEGDVTPEDTASAAPSSTLGELLDIDVGLANDSFDEGNQGDGGDEGNEVSEVISGSRLKIVPIVGGPAMVAVLLAVVAAVSMIDE